jgi:regulator of CtrA degradation
MFNNRQDDVPARYNEIFHAQNKVNALTLCGGICHIDEMESQHHEITPKLVDALYTEAMILADEARSYFDRDPLSGSFSAAVSVAFSCESLKVTTRLMHSIAWLLNQKALRAGELSEHDASSDVRDLGYAPASDEFQMDRFPSEAQELIRASEDLYFRLQRISSSMRRIQRNAPVPHMMRERLLQAF